MEGERLALEGERGDKEIIEIHKTEYVDKEIPSILYEHVKQEDMTRVERTTITVSDKTSKAALGFANKVGKRGDIMSKRWRL